MTSSNAFDSSNLLLHVRLLETILFENDMFPDCVSIGYIHCTVHVSLIE